MLIQISGRHVCEQARQHECHQDPSGTLLTSSLCPVAEIAKPYALCPTCCVHCGTGAMAPPGADSVTPAWPSAVGPRLLHVYCCPASMASLHRKGSASLGTSTLGSCVESVWCDAYPTSWEYKPMNIKGSGTARGECKDERAQRFTWIAGGREETALADNSG